MLNLEELPLMCRSSLSVMLHTSMAGVGDTGFVSPLQKGWMKWAQREVQKANRKLRMMVHPDKHPTDRAVYEEIAKTVGMTLDILLSSDEEENIHEARRDIWKKEKAAWIMYTKKTLSIR